ncbi:MAG: hypothetical protein J6K87_02005 [Clostridia bacterium]|nr:hypothetical protein [Clostridia bacterium]
MREIKNKILIFLIFVYVTSINIYSTGFEFIKTDSNHNKLYDFIYDGSILLYGGILLIVLSVLGIIFTLVPPRKRKNKHKNNNNLDRR